MPAVSHVISGPKDITVCLPVLPQSQPVLKLVYQFHSMYLGIFTMLVGCLGSLRQFPDRQTKNAGGHDKEGMHFFDQVCMEACVCVFEKGGRGRGGKEKTVRGVER